jgi:hypothetical protein
MAADTEDVVEGEGSGCEWLSEDAGESCWVGRFPLPVRVPVGDAAAAVAGGEGSGEGAFGEGVFPW